MYIQHTLYMVQCPFEKFDLDQMLLVNHPQAHFGRILDIWIFDHFLAE